MTYQQLLKDFLMEVKISGRIIVGKQASLEAFARWLDNRQAGEKRRQQEKSDSYTVPVQAAKIMASRDEK